jgi:hypothetical protein
MMMSDQAFHFATVLLIMALMATGAFVVLRGQGYKFHTQGSGRGSARVTELLDSSPSNGLTPLPGFSDRLATVADAVPLSIWQELKREIEANSAIERSYLPTHKKGGTIAYETLRKSAPQTVAFYQSKALARLISGIVGETVRPTPTHDQSSCSILIYDRPGDHIGWHYDHNFYRGRHFTVLIPIVNDGRVPGTLSAARLIVKQADGERTLAVPPNMLVVFEGAKVLHKVTPIEAGERRIVLSMTFGTNPTNSVFQGLARRMKDTAFFGIRALWT